MLPSNQCDIASLQLQGNLNRTAGVSAGDLLVVERQWCSFLLSLHPSSSG